MCILITKSENTITYISLSKDLRICRYNVFFTQVYDELRKNKPQFLDNIVAVEGDVADIRLGLSDTDWTVLTEEVSRKLIQFLLM